MKHHKIAPEKFNKLRKAAKEILDVEGFIKAPVSCEDPLQLIHELQTFQIELELTNEELLRSQLELMESQIKYMELYDYAPMGYVSISLKGKILESNLTLAQMLSTGRADLVNKPLSAYVASKDQPIYYKHLQDLNRSKTRQICELEMEKIDGKCIDVQLESIVILNKEESPEQYRIAVSDISERKQAEKTIREKEELIRIQKSYTELFDFAPVGYLTADLKGIILNANLTLAGMLSCERETLINHPLSDHIVFNDQDIYYRHLRNVSVSKTLETCELCMHKTDGTLFHVQLESTIISNGWIIPEQIRTMVMDISERKQAEKEHKKLQAQLLHAQKMESVGRLAGGVAHEINNALTVIIGFTELAMIQVDPTQPLHANLHEVVISAKSAADITRQLLTFAHKQTISPQKLDLNKNVQNMHKMLARLIGEDIDLTWLPDENPCLVKMDTAQVDQILANLCINARDAIEGVGKVTIQTKNVTFDDVYCTDHIGFISGDFVMLAISDNGCGIEKEVLNNIFEPFFTTKAVDKGTGLGLSTVYGIVSQNNGFISVDSERGKGTTFHIYLPRYECPDAKILEKKTKKVPLGCGEVILLVEDNLAVLKLTQKYLSDFGYTVLAANTPDKALGMAKEHRGNFHLLITDLIMPEMDGRELAEQLQSLHPALKIIFMSGYMANVIAYQGFLAKNTSFIKKPFSKDELGRAVRKILDMKIDFNPRG